MFIWKIDRSFSFKIPDSVIILMDSMTGKKEAEETYTCNDGFETSQHVIISVALCSIFFFMGRFVDKF